MIEQILSQGAVKYGIGVVVLIYVIERLLKIIMFMAKNKKAPEESQMRESSRDRIKESNDTLKTIKPAFFHMKGQVEDVHEVVTAKESGVPLIYNKGLEKSITTLAGAVKALAEKD